MQLYTDIVFLNTKYYFVAYRERGNQCAMSMWADQESCAQYAGG
jgi:hypothetical protein